MFGDRVRQGPTGHLGDTDRGRHGRGDEGWVRQRREVDEPDTVGEVLQEIAARLEGEPRLSGPAGPDDA